MNRGAAEDDASSGRPTRRAFLRSGGLAVAVASGTAAAAVMGSQPLSAETAEQPNSVDLGFLADMTTHHVQAIAMCERVLGRATGGAVQAAATEVLRNQSIEVGMMRAWLADWGQSTAPPTLAMGWMGMNGGQGMPSANMPGLASDAEMRSLATEEGEERGRLWLVLMRAHHVAGVAMADAAAAGAATTKVRRLATTQSTVQTYEIYQYDQLLNSEYR